MISRLSPLSRYCLALGAVLLAFLLFRGFGALVGGELPLFITFYPCVMMVALLAGTGPGLTATALSVLIADYYLLAPLEHFGIDSLRDTFSLALFAGMGIFICVTVGMYHRQGQQGAVGRAGAGRRQGRTERLLTAAGMLASLAILLTVFSLVRHVLKADNDADSQVFHSQTVLDDLDRLLSKLKDAETGERGYLITRRPQFLEPYRGAEQETGALLKTLLGKTAGNPSQQQHLTRLGSLAGEKLAVLKDHLELSSKRGFQDAFDAVAAGRGKALMDEIRREVAQVRAEEQRVLRDHVAEMAARRRSTERALMGGGLLSLMLLGTVFMFLVQENRLRREAEAGLLDYQDHLQDLVARRTAELAEANAELEQEIAGHRQARQELNLAHEVLEQRVTERTAELENRNAQLIVEATERRKAEAALSQSEERYRDIVENQTEFVDRFLPGGVLTFVNDALVRMTGLRREQLLGRSYYPFVHDDDRPQLIRTIESLTPENPTADTLNRVMLTDGVHWQRWKLRALFDRDGDLMEYQSTGRDVTEQMLVQEALRESEERYRAVVEDQTELITRYRPDGSYIFVNKAFCRFFGKSYHEVVGRNWLPDAVAGDVAMIEARLRELSPLHPVVVIENRVVSGSGEIRWMQFVNHGFFDAQGRLVETQGVGRDITERKLLDETLERYTRRLIVLEEELRKRIAMELHDDVGQVLTALGFNLAHIAKTLPPESGEGLRLTLDDSRQLTKEVSRKVRNLMVDLRPAQLEDYGLAAAVRSYAEQYARRTGIAVAVNVDPLLPRLPVKKELALFRITQEALNNVVKHAAANNITVCLANDGAAITLSISDDGNGFLPQTALPSATGSGWGLTIMRERAELAGGRFRLDTVPGKGTCIVIELREEPSNGN